MNFLRRLYTLLTLGLGIGLWLGWYDKFSSNSWNNRVLLVIIFLIGGAACLTPAWRMLRHTSTLIHEVSHAMTAIILGGRVKKITYKPDSSGLATYSLPLGFGRPRIAIAAFSGYCGPAVAGILGAKSVDSGLGAYWLMVVGILALGALVLMVRSLWGLIYTAVLAALLCGLALSYGWGGGIWASMFSGILNSAAIKDTIVQMRVLNKEECDAVVVGRSLFLPASLIGILQIGLAVLSFITAFLIIAGLI